MSTLACFDVCETAVQGRWQSPAPPYDPSWLVFCCLSHRLVYYQVKKDCRHDTFLKYAGLDLKVQAAASSAAVEVVVEAVDDLDDVQGNPIGSQDAPKTISVDAVEGFFKVNKN